MDDALDWGPVLDRLRAGWRAILVIALAGAAASAARDVTRADRYRAEAVVAVARPAPPIELDPRFEAPEPNPEFPYQVSSLRAYPELVRADGIAQAVLDALRADAATAPFARPFADFDDLRARVTVEALAEGGLITIRARAASPAAAAAIANTWATVFSTRMAAVFGPTDRLGPLAAAADAAAVALATAEAAADRPGAPARLERERRRAEARAVAIARTVDELTLAHAAARPEVRVASPAVPSRRLPWGDVLQRALAAAALGALGGAAWALRPGPRAAR